MSQSNSKRLFALVVAALLLASYRLTRDTVRVQGHLRPKTVKQIVAQAQEWSAPKLFRHIEIEAKDNGTILASIREPQGHWSVTVFTNSEGVWRRCGWYLLREDKAGIVRPPT